MMMKKIAVVILFAALSWQGAFAQKGVGSNEQWNNTYKEQLSRIRSAGATELKKMVFLDGDLVYNAVGTLSYQAGKGNTEMLPFVYSYGRIMLPAGNLKQLLNGYPDTTSVKFTFYFNLSTREETKIKEIAFGRTLKDLKELVEKADYTRLESFLAITTFEKCYITVCQDYSMIGRSYSIPSQKHQMKKMMRTLDELYEKQYPAKFQVTSKK